MTAVFNQQTITDAIHTKWAGKTVHFVKETASTNQLAKQIVGELPEQETFHGMLVTAEHQTAGRGRLGRSWLAPAGKCVTMTLLLKPDFAPQYASMLTLVMGLSVAEAIGKMGLDKKDIVYIGDTEVDIQTADNAGIDCIGVDWGFRDGDYLRDLGAKYIVNTPMEVLEIVL